MARRDRDDDDTPRRGKSDDEKPERGRGRSDERDEPKSERSARGRGGDTGGSGSGSDVSLDDSDAIETGLFASGPAVIKESLFDHYDYQGTSRNPPVVWLIVYERGSGKDRETYEQPYSMGKGWDVDKKTGKLVAKQGQSGLPKSCNAIKHLVKPLKAALEDAKIDLPTKNGLGMDPRVLEGMEVEVERVDQEERNIRDERGRDNRDRGRQEKKEPGTILEIVKVESAPWEKGRGRSKSRDEKEETTARPSRGRSRDKEPEKEEARPSRTPRGSKEEHTGPSDDDALMDDAIEAIIGVVEASKEAIKIGDELEEALEKQLKGVKSAGAIIDLAADKKTLELEKGWSFDGKYVDVAK